MKTVLTIAGSDCSGGAGIQADIKTITVHKLYAMSVITSLTAQNTMGVFEVAPVSPEFIAKQMDCIFSDIRPDAVKIGMVVNRQIIQIIVQKLTEYHAENIVVDPVMVSTSGSPLLDESAMESMVLELFPLATVITPNIPEAQALCGFEIQNEIDMLRAAEHISKMIGGANLVKGGHLENTASDLLYSAGYPQWFRCERIENPNTHGTGCTLSSAIACNLALGHSLAKSVQNAKEYISGAIKAGLNLGNGRGPLDHTYMYLLNKKSNKK